MFRFVPVYAQVYVVKSIDIFALIGYSYFVNKHPHMEIVFDHQEDHEPAEPYPSNPLDKGNGGPAESFVPHIADVEPTPAPQPTAPEPPAPQPTAPEPPVSEPTAPQPASPEPPVTQPTAPQLQQQS